MNDEIKDKILKSESGQRMLGMVSPIYDKSYVGLWIMEAIGREYDTLRELLDPMADNSIQQQISPRTATWALELWERSYGIEPDLTQPIERRREILMSRLAGRGAFTPRKLADFARATTGQEAWVKEYSAPYTFSIYLAKESDKQDILMREIQRIKPAHLTVRIIVWRLTWDELDDRETTWDALDSMKLTWDNFEVWDG